LFWTDLWGDSCLHQKFPHLLTFAKKYWSLCQQSDADGIPTRHVPFFLFLNKNLLSLNNWRFYVILYNLRTINISLILGATFGGLTNFLQLMLINSWLGCNIHQYSSHGYENFSVCKNTSFSSG
jgi:hypothetical protein